MTRARKVTKAEWKERQDRSPIAYALDAAELIGCSMRTLRRWRREGTGPEPVIADGRLCYRLCDLDRFIAGRWAKGWWPPL
jgi:hypothetical protein